MSEAIDYAALNWVRQELGEVLKQARLSLEQYAGNQDDGSSLQDCAKNLHQARGPLRMVELKGADQLASEMEELIADLLQTTLEEPQLALEVLMQAFLQLSDYLSRLQPCTTDSPALLLPVMNRLREVRGVPVLGERAIFAPDLTIPVPPMVSTAHMPASDEEIQVRARAARTRFQAGLLEWYRGKEGNNGLQTLLAVLMQMREHAGRDSVARLWWAAAAITEAMIAGDIPQATENKQMYGQLDRQIKRLIEVGEPAFEDPLTDELMKSLLYRIAITESSLESIQLLKANYALESLLDGFADNTAGDEGLAGYSSDLLQTVAATAAEDVERIKDRLDVFTCGNKSDPDSLLPVADELHALGKMLEMVGMDELGNLVVEKAQPFRDMATGTSGIEDTQLMAVADLLVAVEDAMHSLADGEAMPASGGTEDLFLQEGMQAVAREAVADMVRAKEVVVEYMGSPENFETLAEVPVLLSRVRGSLQLSKQDRAAIAIGQVQQFIAGELLEQHKPMSASQLDLLADAICSIEYYLEESGEALDEGNGVLAIAENSLDKLGYACPSMTQEPEPETAQAPEPEPEPEPEQAGYEPVELSLQPDQSGSGTLADARAVSMITDLQVIDVDADEEILAIFIEEAEEVLPRLGEQLAAWTTAADDEQSLMDARRGFHTIKGSGRMVGALALAEFAWAFEDLLNRVIEGRVEPVAELLALFSQPVAAMTQLLAQVKGSDAALQADVNALAYKASMLSQPGRQPVAVEAEAEVPVVCIEQPADEPVPQEPVRFSACPVLADDADPEILEIYLEEADEEIDSIAEVLPQWVKQPDNPELLATLRRSLHTLKGSGRMAGAMRIGEFCLVLEKLFNSLIDGSVKVNDPVFILMKQVPLALQQLREQLCGGSEPTINLEEMMLHAEAISRGEVAEPLLSHEELPTESCEDEHISSDELAEEDPENDTELLGIFTRECIEHLSIIEEFLNSNQPPCVVTETLYRSLHTISGISNSSNVGSINRLAATLDNHFDGLYQGQHLAGADALALLGDSTKEMRRLIQQLPDMAFDGEYQQQLCSRIEALPKTGETQPVNDPYASMDSELLEIFIEEASEIIDAGETTLEAWSEDPSNQEHMVEFQRQLHTLKGGARMVDIQPIGDLSHTLESLLTRVVEGQLEATPDLFVMLHDSHDHLAEMLEHVKSREAPADASELHTVIGGVGQEADVVDAAEPCDTEAVVESVGVEAVADVAAAEEPEPETVAEQDAGSEAGQELEPERELELEAGLTTSAQVAELPDSGSDVEAAASVEIQSEPAQMKKMGVLPPVAEPRKSSRVRSEQVRVRADLLDNMVNYAGEINIYRARMEQQVSDYRYNLGELDQTIGRLREQLRQVEIETETHVLFRYEQDGETAGKDFDPLEMDRYSNLQEMSRSLIESIGDLRSIQELLESTTRESETLLLQQARVSTDLQEGLLHSRMIPFAGLAPRLRRILRQSARELGKKVDLRLEGADGEMDRTVIDRMIAPLEHMLRNSVAHGIEDPATRKQMGKPEAGSVTISFDREGSEIVLCIEDDGAGLDTIAIRARAVERGLLDADAEISDNDIMQFVLQAGFSTATEVTQISGRGVGMDVVSGEVKQLGGSLHITSTAGVGTVFTVRLPYTLAVNQALLVKANEETFCVPLGIVEGIARISPEELGGCYQTQDRLLEYAGNQYQLKHLGSLLGCGGMEQAMQQDRVPVLLVSIGEKRVAFQLESILGSQEIVIKPLGAQLSNVEGISGATILGDGRVVLILDVMSLSRMQGQLVEPDMSAASRDSERLHVMVVDDSITVRKVTTRLLERNGFRVWTAKDGVDALGQLQDNIPDIMLLDIEMPRMDGFELATHMRNDDRLKHIPVMMITSRTGDKHRQHAKQLGVNYYLGKPYQESELLEAIQDLIDVRNSEVYA